MQMDGTAFTRHLSAHRDRVYSQALWVVRHDQDAEDITQEAFLRLWRSGGDLPESGVLPWLLRVTHNLCIDRTRRQGALIRNLGRPDGEAVDRLAWNGPDSAGPDGNLAAEDRRREIMAALATLGEETRSVMLMHYFQGMKVKDIAAALGKNLNSVKVQIHRARKTLRLVLAEDHRTSASRQETV